MRGEGQNGENRRKSLKKGFDKSCMKSGHEGGSEKNEGNSNT